MKMKKSLLAVLLSMLFMFSSFVPSISCYAVGDSWTSSQSYSYFENHFDDINTRLNGVIINQNRLRESFEDYLQEYRDNYNIPSGTSTTTWIGDNISGTYQNGSSGNADVSFSETFRQAMRDWCDTYISTNTGYIYAYTFGSAEYISLFSDQVKYHAFLNFISEHDSNIIMVSSSGSYLYLPHDEIGNIGFVRRSYLTNYSLYTVDIYSDWNSFYFDEYSYDSSQEEYILSSSNYTISTSGSERTLKNTISPNPNRGSYSIVNQNSKQVILYNTFDSMKNGSEGIQDYYTVSDSYNSTISGSYNTTTNNIQNTLTNSDVSNYINNYYVQNGSYPTPNEINIYINQNINSGSGGGSGGDNGNGSDDDNNNIWDFLGSIGDFLGNLISSLGSVLSGILSLLTDVIDMFIGENGLPNVIGSLISYFMPFLPEWVPTLIGFSVVLALILGVIKLIRG